MASQVKIEERQVIREKFIAWMESLGVRSITFHDKRELQGRFEKWCGHHYSRKQFNKAIGGLSRSSKERPRQKKAIIGRPVREPQGMGPNSDEKYQLRLV